MFKKVLIANRGEIALRVIRACKELGIRSVAVYSAADKESLHVRFADEAVCIGPAIAKDSYLNIPNILSAAEITNADAIHPGYGFLAENAEFSRICTEHNIKFIGPSPLMIASMGDKASARKHMKEAGVPIIPGSKGLLKNYTEAQTIADQIGYPVLLKATAGGGGKGIRLVSSPDAFSKAWSSAQSEAEAAFGNPGVYIEKYIAAPRHIEIQVLGDQHGRVHHLSERDCSIQRRHQKLIEETPSIAVSDKLRKKMGDTAIQAAASIKYEGCGTVEFLCDDEGIFYFLEMNTRIQVEHPITEEVTGVDLIKAQLQVAAGQSIEDTDFYPQRHAIECRINAEDIKADFRPSPGRINNLNLPGGPGVRIDTHIYSGYLVPSFYDSLLAKLIVSAPTRKEAILRMGRALNEFVIEGIETTLPLHRRIMEDARFIKGQFSTHFLNDFPFDRC